MSKVLEVIEIQLVALESLLQEFESEIVKRSNSIEIIKEKIKELQQQKLIFKKDNK